jgi:ABC-2 type transport system ATP-binding protein
VGDALRVEKLVKRYGSVTAVDEISLTVEPGTVFSLLGPNGAGKTTTLEIIEGLRVPDAGHVWYGARDLVRHPDVGRRYFGVQLQANAFFDLLTVRETLQLFSSLYPKALPLGTLLERLDLVEQANVRVQALSGGQRQRLALACALVHDPAVVFLDEPSAGLDPQARRHLWDVVQQLRAEGRTVVLTTHYMEEAETLSDRVAIMDHGRILDEGSPDALIRRHLPASVIEVDRAVPLDDLDRMPALVRVERGPDATVLVTERLEDTLVGLVAWATARGIPLTGLRTRGATLEDVFLALTGRRLGA